MWHSHQCDELGVSLGNKGTVPLSAGSDIVGIALPDGKRGSCRVSQPHTKNCIGKKASVQGNSSLLDNSAKESDGLIALWLTAGALEALLVAQRTKVSPEKQKALVARRMPVEETASSRKESR